MSMLVLAALLLQPAQAFASAAFAGMGGVGVGVPDSSGDISGNAAAAADLPAWQGAVHLGGSWKRLAFSGSVLNRQVRTVSNFPVAEGLGWTMVTPVIGAGRVGFGAWQVEHHELEIKEPLDLSLPGFRGTPPLAFRYYRGYSLLRQEETLNAYGATWIQPISGRSQQLSIGAAYLDRTGRGHVEAYADTSQDDVTEGLIRLATRRSQRGFAFLAGYFYRPVEAGSLGVSLQYLGELKGYVWEQADGGNLYRDKIDSPARMCMGFGGSFRIIPSLTAAVDVKLVGESKATSRWLFAGTPVQRYATEFSDSTMAFHAGVEYRLRFEKFDLPFRVGFFNEPDSKPVQPAGAGALAVADFRPVSFKQDVTGFSVGTGWERGGFSADLALLWLSVNTYVKKQMTDSEVSSGDVRDTLGLVGSVSLRFGRGGNDSDSP